MGLFWTILHVACLGAAAALFAAAAISDARGFRIPNSLCLFLLALFPLYVISAPAALGWPYHLAVAVVILGVGYAFFLAKLAGAGDAKLLAVAGLWAGPAFVLPLLVATALAGGLLAGSALVQKAWRARQRHEPLSFAHIPLPYGIAIATGGITVLGLIARPLLFVS